MSKGVQRYVHGMHTCACTCVMYCTCSFIYHVHEYMCGCQCFFTCVYLCAFMSTSVMHLHHTCNYICLCVYLLAFCKCIISVYVHIFVYHMCSI